MKVNISGDTPMERLTNLTKRVIAVPKTELEREEKKWQRQRVAKRRKRR